MSKQQDLSSVFSGGKYHRQHHKATTTETYRNQPTTTESNKGTLPATTATKDRSNCNLESLEECPGHLFSYEDCD